MTYSSITNPSAARNDINRSRRDKLKHCRSAVDSHSSHKASNKRAFSPYIRNEQTMYHTERKSFKLPCGKTLAQSWAGLRKSWLGFKIALSNGDRYRMRHYALFIRKVQKEMGIEVTKFDSDILDEQERVEGVAECAAGEDEGTREDEEEDERSPDYDVMTKDAHDKLSRNCETTPVPRQNIFERQKESTRNLSSAKSVKIRSEGRKSCDYRFKDEQVKAQTSSKGLRNNSRKSCEYDLVNKQLVQAHERSEVQMEAEEDEPDYFEYSGNAGYAQASQEMEDLETDEDRNCDPYTDDDTSQTDEKERIRIRANSCTYNLKW
jgi:hypothetical protein